PERLNTGIVYLRKDGRFLPKTVTLGKRNDNDVLVTHGLKPGDVLAEEQPPASLIGPAAHKPGVRRAAGGQGHSDAGGPVGALMTLLNWGQRAERGGTREAGGYPRSGW